MVDLAGSDPRTPGVRYVARWIIATLAFLAIGWLDYAYGHGVALVTMLALLVLVAVFGGHRPRRRPESSAGEPDQAPGPDDAP